MKTLRMFLATFLNPVKDLRVFGWTILMGVLAYMTDPQGLKMIGVVLYVSFFWLFALAIRKVLFPYNKPGVDEDHDGKWDPLKLSDFFREALNGNLAAAIVAFAQIILMCCVAMTFTMWLR